MGIITQAGWGHWLSRSLLMGGQIASSLGAPGVLGEQCARRPASALQGARLGTLGVSTPTMSWMSLLGSKMWAAV